MNVQIYLCANTGNLFLTGGCEDQYSTCLDYASKGKCTNDNWMMENCKKSCGKCKSGKYRVIKPILPGLWKYGGIIVSKIAQIVKKTKDSSVQALTMSKFKFG